jgi:uncharacterized protein
MAARDVRKNINLFVDGRGYAGQLDEFNAPELKQTTEEFRGGGMLGKVKLSMGLEPLDTSFALISYDKDVIALFGIAEGAKINLSARETLESFDGEVKAVTHTMRGKIVTFTPGTSKAGELQPIKIEMSLTYYRLEHSGTVLHEIDLENMVHVINGIDSLAAQRRALGF